MAQYAADPLPDHRGHLLEATGESYWKPGRKAVGSPRFRVQGRLINSAAGVLVAFHSKSSTDDFFVCKSTRKMSHLGEFAPRLWGHLFDKLGLRLRREEIWP